MNGLDGFVPLAAAAPLLVWVAIGDLRHLRIPNWLVLGLAAVFVLAAPSLPLQEIGLRLLAAALVFLLCAALFHWQVLAGGDVKMMGAAMLFVPSPALISFGWSFSAAMIAVVIAAAALRMRRPGAAAGWAVVRAPGSMPMGAAISSALLLLPAVWLYAG